tara:strand:- start:1931 stop:2296 length:366 start_codon:yes stop_codon:yes gene_type:complete
MKNTEDLNTWYGEIQSSRGNIIVIRDEQLPPANKGRMYLYNTDRDAVIEYDQAIVAPKLVELSEEDKQQVIAKHTKAWEAARKQFIRAHTKTTTTSNRKTESSLDLLPSDDDDTSDDDDDD